MKKQKKRCSITAMITLIVLTHTLVNGLMVAGMIVYGFSSLTPHVSSLTPALSEGEGESRVAVDLPLTQSPDPRLAPLSFEEGPGREAKH